MSGRARTRSRDHFANLARGRLAWARCLRLLGLCRFSHRVLEIPRVEPDEGATRDLESRHRGVRVDLGKTLQSSAIAIDVVLGEYCIAREQELTRAIAD